VQEALYNTITMKYMKKSLNVCVKKSVMRNFFCELRKITWQKGNKGI